MVEDKQASVLKSIGGFASVAFLLLGVLFGMQIMTFIFAQFSPDASNIFTDSSITVTNESGAWLNITTYTVDNSAALGFSNLVITGAFNDTDASTILTGNFTVSDDGFTNSTSLTWINVSVSYTYDRYSDSRIASGEINNNSLQGIVSYTAQSTTQMSTVAIAITLAILIALFLLFWVFFIKDQTKGDSSMGGNFE